MQKRNAKLVVKDEAGQLIQLLPEVQVDDSVNENSELPVSSEAVFEWGADLQSSLQNSIQTSIEANNPYVLVASSPEDDQSGSLDSERGIIFYVPDLNSYTWNVVLTLDSPETVPVPFCLYSTQNASIDVDWGDGTVETFTSADASEDVFPAHEYQTAGTYAVSITSSTWDSIYITDCRNLDLAYWKSSLTAVSNPLPHLAGTHTCADSYTDWAHISNVLQYTFYNCFNLSAVPENLYAKNPLVSSLSHAFSGCAAMATIPQNLLAYPTAVSNLNGFISGGASMTLGAFSISIASPNVSDADGFTGVNSSVSRTISVPANSTTKTTFDALAAASYYTVTAS